jgi:hypothetical protein
MVADGRTFRLGEWGVYVGGLIVSKTPTTALFAKGIAPSSIIAPLRLRTEAENDAAAKQSKRALVACLDTIIIATERGWERGPCSSNTT